MKNFSVIHDNKEYWISRSIAVVVKIIAYSRKGNPYVLAVQRGIGTPDPEFIGSWCLPCGYLDYNETIEEAGVREVFEETGLKLDSNYLTLEFVDSIPSNDKRQNVVFLYEYVFPPSEATTEDLKKSFSTKFSEKDEVNSIRFINISEINEFKWAFNHNKFI